MQIFANSKQHFYSVMEFYVIHLKITPLIYNYY